ncbi:hypothetical protein ACOMHN_005384 [Nucella lapillus]
MIDWRCHRCVTVPAGALYSTLSPACRPAGVKTCRSPFPDCSVTWCSVGSLGPGGKHTDKQTPDENTGSVMTPELI